MKNIIGRYVWLPLSSIVSLFVIVVAVLFFGQKCDPEARTGEYFPNKPAWFARFDRFMIRVNALFGIQ